MPDVYYDSTLTGQELDEALRNIPANVERAEAASTNAEKSAKTSESWAHGGTETREGEETNNAEYWAGQARSSAETASTGAKVVTDNEEALRAVKENITAIQNAPQAAERAEAAADSAEGDADRAELAADRAQSIGQGALGYYAKAADLQAAHESGENGQWAIVGETDTIWVWDSDTQSWSNSGNKTDLSQYYTKDETDEQINELQAALGQQITGATSRAWTVTVSVTAWTDGTGTWAGISAMFKAEIPCEGMTAGTVLAPPQYAGGDLASAQAFAWADSGEGVVTLYSETKPGAEFILTLTEVK